jgi:hypothetical protein
LPVDSLFTRLIRSFCVFRVPYSHLGDDTGNFEKATKIVQGERPELGASTVSAKFNQLISRFVSVQSTYIFFEKKLCQPEPQNWSV